MAAVKNWTCRIVGDRVQQWAEHQQWGFRRGRIDVLLLILTLVELAPSVNLDNSENRGSHYDNWFSSCLITARYNALRHGWLLAGPACLNLS